MIFQIAFQFSFHDHTRPAADHGLSPELINCCDLQVSIPMLGTGTSLNAAVATGVLLYEIRRQQRPEHRIADRLAMESDLKDVSII